MPKVALQLKAEMENLTALKTDGEDFKWFMKLKCESCGEETSNHVSCSQADSYPLKGGRGQANLVIRCKLCKRENSIEILKDSVAAYNAEDAGQYKVLVKFDCRGMTPTEFDLRDGWTVKGEESNTSFDVDFQKDKEFFEYDEEANVSVSITEVSSQFVVVKH